MRQLELLRPVGTGRTTGIGWTEHTVNTWAGCEKESEGCKNCYAISTAAWIERMGSVPNYAGLTTKREAADGRMVVDWAVDPTTGKPKLGWSESSYEKILRFPAGALVFMNSMTDFFLEEAPDEWRVRTFEQVAKRPDVVFQVLTKRIHLVAATLERMKMKIPSNVWIGATVENARWRTRIDELRKIEATIRFLSVEPLLDDATRKGFDLTDIHWVIAGGESGSGARPMKPDWPRRVRDACVRQGVPYFFKQWGTIRNNPDPDDPTLRAKEKKGGNRLDGVFWEQLPDLFWERWGPYRTDATPRQGRTLSLPVVD